MTMQTKKKTKVIQVKEHARKVPVSPKNPKGVTIVDQHQRHIDGRFLDRRLIDDVSKNYDRNGLKYPASKKIQFRDADKFDDLIAIWCDYFNKKFILNPQLIRTWLKL